MEEDNNFGFKNVEEKDHKLVEIMERLDENEGAEEEEPSEPAGPEEQKINEEVKWVHTSSSENSDDEFEDAVEVHYEITRSTKSRKSNIPDEAIMFV